LPEQKWASAFLNTAGPQGIALGSKNSLRGPKSYFGWPMRLINKAQVLFGWSLASRKIYIRRLSNNRLSILIPTEQLKSTMEEKVFSVCGDYMSLDATVIPFSDIAREQWNLPRGPDSGPEMPSRRRPGLLWEQSRSGKARSIRIDPQINFIWDF